MTDYSAIDAEGARPANPADHPLLHTLVVVHDPASIEAEAVRGLRTRIAAQHIREGRRSLAICSPAEGSGGTFIAANLALALSQIGVKTALIDADLRAPGIAGMFGSAAAPGLAEYLGGSATRIDEIVQPSPYSSLSIVPAGAEPANPQELLSSGRFRDFANEMLREYDLTIFDTTAANRCSDALRVASVAAYSLIVGRKHQTFVNDIAVLAGQLRADRSMVVGTVLNDF